MVNAIATLRALFDIFRATLAATDVALLDCSEQFALFVNAYIALLSAYAHCGTIEDAKATWRRIHNKHLKSDPLIRSCYVDCLSKHGLFEEAKQAMTTKN